MTQLIPLHSQTIDGNAVETVNARELHAYLESKQDFSNWINNRIKQYNFMENQDFILVLNQQNKVSNKIIENPKNPKNKGGRPTKEYFLSLDMAKELSMVERTDKGKQARQYFIECERKLRETQAKLAPKTYVEALRTLADEVEAHELIQTFNFDDDFVRVVVDDTNNPLFVAKDVATVLGYSDTTNAIKQHCKGVAKHHPIATPMSNEILKI